MYVYMISFEISSSPCTPGITNEPLCGVHDASPFGSAISSAAISRIENCYDFSLNNKKPFKHRQIAMFKGFLYTLINY